MLAEEWYRKSAEQGHADSQYSLGAMYDKGIISILPPIAPFPAEAATAEGEGGGNSTTKAPTTSVTTTTTATAAAMTNESEAMRWYGKAAAQGCEDASAAMTALLARVAAARRRARQQK